MENQIKTFREFHKLLKKVKKIREKVLKSLESGKNVKEAHIEKLREYLKDIKNIPQRDGSYVLLTDHKESIYTSLEHEIEGIRRDLIFLRQGEKDLNEYMARQKPHFEEEKNKISSYLNKVNLDSFISDRDGTLSNYAERYFSSLQTIYTALFLGSFIDSLDNSIIISSAPLGSLREVNILDRKELILAGSRGREFISDGKIRRFNLPRREGRKLYKLSNEIKHLLRFEKFSKFAFLGSGFQEKFGSITVARQDISGSVSKKRSEDFLKRVKEILEWLDPNGDYFEVEDTGLDINISLKWNKSIFDKGAGVCFISDMEHLNLGNSLICGNSESDLSMIEKTANLSDKQNAVFVTKDENLRKRCKETIKNPVFASSPEALIFALRKSAKKYINN